MNITVSGNITDKNKSLFKEAVEYFAKKLMSTRMANSLNISLQIKNNMSVENSSGGCASQVNGSSASKDFIIEIQHAETIQDQLLFLAHEMVHLYQGSSNTLQYRQWKSDNKVHVRWSGQEMGFHDEVPYDDRPWEKQAYALQQPLLGSFLCFKFGTTEQLKGYDETLTKTMRSVFNERNMAMAYE